MNEFRYIVIRKGWRMTILDNSSFHNVEVIGTTESGVLLSVQAKVLPSIAAASASGLTAIHDNAVTDR